MLFLKNALYFFIALSIAGCISAGNDMPDNAMAAIEKGRFLVIALGCNDCHAARGKDRDGDVPEANWLTGNSLGFTGAYGTVYPTNLRLLVNEISEREWLLLVQQITSNSPMALTRLPSLNDEDLKAIYRFIRQLGPKGDPVPERLPPGVMPTTDFIPFPLTH